jgi:hypothetical protein
MVSQQATGGSDDPPTVRRNDVFDDVSELRAAAAAVARGGGGARELPGAQWCRPWARIAGGNDAVGSEAGLSWGGAG